VAVDFRRPFLRVSGPLVGAGDFGGELVERLGTALIGVRLTDQAGYGVDECTIRVRRRTPFRAVPPRGTRYVVQAGWSAEGMAIGGVYTFQRLRILGDPETGQELQLVCRAGDFVDKLKAVDSEHFDAANGHKTYGDVFRTLAKRAGVPARVAQSLAGLPLPNGYDLRWQQSAIDYATQLGDQIGGLVKPQGGALVVLERGAGKSASGQALPTIVIPYEEDRRFEVDLEPRHEYAQVGSGWFDGTAGRLQEERHQTRRQFSRLALPHPFGSQPAAKRGAEAAAKESGSYSGTGYFEMRGDPAAVAEAKVQPRGFGPGVDDVPWIADLVVQDIEPDSGWFTSVETLTEGG